MARVTPSDVQAIMDTGLSDTGLRAHIEAAALVTNEALTDDDGVPVHDEDRMTSIERYVAAHFAAAQDPTVEKDGLGTARVTYETATGDGMAETRYGRRAIELDSTGTLRDGTKAPAEFDTWGTTYDAEVD